MKVPAYFRILSILLAILFIISPIACSKPTANEDISGAWFKSVDYTGIMTRISSGSDPDLFYANQALQNTIYVWRGLEPYKYEENIDWSIDGNKSNTWLLYFQSLQVVGYLANAAEVSADKKYLEKAAEIIESWVDFHDGNPNPPQYAWYDASVTNRIQNITHFLRAYASLEDITLSDSLFKRIYAMLQQHADWLLEEENYHPNNHGFMASMSLAQISLTFPQFEFSALYRNTSLKRIRERIQADVSMEGVHREHSCFYQLFFLNLIMEADAYLRAKSISLFDPGDHIVERMKEYLAYITKPDLSLPLIGDTSYSTIDNDYEHPWLAYSLTYGREGIRPPQNSMVYSNSGTAILRDEWKSGDEFTDTTFLMFQSAFNSVTHKHADDLGFVLYSHGEDIFVGPGVYAYGSSKYRGYVISTQAHNTLTVDEESYPVKANNAGKANITAYHLDEAFDFVQGSHTMYNGVILKRSVLLIRPSTILIIDEAISDTQHTIQQIFNLAPAAHDLKFDQKGASFLVGDKGVRVELRQLCASSGVRDYYGQENPVRGFVSPKQNTIVPIHQLEFENYGDGFVFVTQISVAETGDDMPNISVDCSSPYMKIEVYSNEEPPLLINLEQFIAQSNS